jgi:hypothetical protein
MDDGLGPGKGRRIAVIGLDEGIDVLLELLDGSKGCAREGLSFEDGEPTPTPAAGASESQMVADDLYQRCANHGKFGSTLAELSANCRCAANTLPR